MCKYPFKTAGGGMAIPGGQKLPGRISPRHFGKAVDKPECTSREGGMDILVSLAAAPRCKKVQTGPGHDNRRKVSYPGPHPSIPMDRERNSPGVGSRMGEFAYFSAAKGKGTAGLCRGQGILFIDCLPHRPG